MSNYKYQDLQDHIHTRIQSIMSDNVMTDHAKTAFLRSFEIEATYRYALLKESRADEAAQRTAFLLGMLDTLRVLGLLSETEDRALVDLSYGREA